MLPFMVIPKPFLEYRKHIPETIRYVLMYLNQIKLYFKFILLQISIKG